MQLTYPQHPKVGLVIGTYASIPYIHLQLEARKRFYPSVPVLVHDDGSPRWRDLHKLCREHGADAHLATTRTKPDPHILGDLSAFVQGLLWADRIGVDLLVKFSRRWVVLRDWVTELRDLAVSTQYQTYSNYCTSSGFGFRTECIAMHVPSWFGSGFIEESRDRISRGDLYLPEMYVHHWSDRVMQSACQTNCDFDRCVTKDDPFDGCLSGYGQWSLLGTDRRARRDHQLWHDSAGPGDYLMTGRSLGVDYHIDDWHQLN
jgi:hypothetical protein